jgi:23S rRNA pseudouridine1911/1915/1917 synthase
VERLPGWSRGRIQRLIDAQAISIAGSAVKASCKLRGGETIRLLPGPEPEHSLAPEPIPLEIVYEDEDLAVINKPAGLVVHHGAGVHSGTLVNALLYHFQQLSHAGGADRPGIVHRLDKQTSGLIVIAKNESSHQQLSQQFLSRTVRKQYIALVHGAMEDNAGEISAPIGRDRVHRMRMTTRARRSREAHTGYEVLERFPGFTLLRVSIKTGRTHQIRVHFSARKHPVVGDTLYGAPAQARVSGATRQLPSLHRNFLHAAHLEFAHPRSGQPMSFSAELPAELNEFLQLLRI